MLVVADPSSPSAPSDPTLTASFRTYVIGIVTHGGLQNPHWKFGPAWQAQAASILKSQGYNAVIAYNWVTASNHPGQAAIQGPRWPGRSLLWRVSSQPLIRLTFTSSATARELWSTPRPSSSSRA